jgi:hypothetical protein
MATTKTKSASKPKAAAGKKQTAKPKSSKTSKAAARVLTDEQTRRENAAARIRMAAEAAGIQKARTGLFIERLQARLARSAERVEKLVEAEWGRQALMLEKYPELKQLNGEPHLDEAAKIPDVEISESKLPAYITNIHLTDVE